MGYIMEGADFLNGTAAQIAVIVAGVLGIVLCLLGLKLVRVWNVLVGFTVGACAGQIGAWMLGQDMTVILIASGVAGIVLAILAGILRRFGVFILCLAAGFGLAVQIINPSNAVMSAVCGAIGLILAILAMIRLEPVVIIVTALEGGVLASTAVVEITGIGQGAIWYVIAAVAALIGMSLQFMMRSREIGRKEKRYAQSVKEEISKEAEVEQMRALLDDEEEDAE